jgi:hypothetical protein
MVRLQVSLTSDEAETLHAIAESELRDPREHIRYLLHQEFKRLGFESFIGSISQTQSTDNQGGVPVLQSNIPCSSGLECEEDSSS